MNAEFGSRSQLPPARVEPGTQLGAYEILLPVARGGMARVWAARQHGARGFSRLVALKTVLPELAEPEFESMFLDEARVAARIHHPNVCEIFELVEHSGVLALSMEWIDGETLNAILGSEGQHPPLDVRIAAQIVAEAACGLHAAHELRDESGTPMQLVHRDVSPQNILVARNGRVKVTDFGVAKALGGSSESTAVGQIKGKLGYMSPEQAEGGALNRRSDIFSLGVVLYLATTGAHPFRRPGQSRQEQYLRLLTDSATPPSALVPGYPLELEAIVLRALARDQSQRFPSAEELRRHLLEWLVQSGPLVTEQDIARAVRGRVGSAMDERADRIAAHLRASRSRKDSLPRGGRAVSQLPAAEHSAAAVSSAATLTELLGDGTQSTEVTFVPTTLNASRGRRLQKLPGRFALTVIAAGIGALVFCAVGWSWLAHERIGTLPGAAFAAPGAASHADRQSQRTAPSGALLDPKPSTSPNQTSPVRRAPAHAAPAHAREGIDRAPNSARGIAGVTPNAPPRRPTPATPSRTRAHAIGPLETDL